jgi:23S rRNA (cytosine1962-C5)-methyltransferase
MEAVLKAAIGEFFGSAREEALRVFHGRGHLYPGLEHVCIDWFKPLVLVTAYGEIADAGELSADIVEADKLGQVKSIILQKRYQQGAPVELLFGDDLPCLIVQENKLVFEVHPGRQQNAGLFLDTRPLREWLQAHSEGKNVLNLFAYTCSLSVAALAGGATRVTNVDISKTSINWGEKNHQLNNQPMDQVKSIPYNLFRSWGRIQQYGRYDLVVIDPPTRQRGSFDVEKNYRSVIRKLSKMCKPGADIIATVNSPFLESNYLLGLFSANLRNAEYVEAIPAAAEFADKYPQRGLKICRFKLT